jgi:hypothetical protein
MERMNQDDMPSNDVQISEKDTEPSIIWDIAFPLVTNRFFLYDMIKVTFFSCFVFILIFFVILAIDKSLHSLPGFLLMWALFFVAFNVLFLFIALFFFGNRYAARFAISEKGVSWETRSKRAKTANRAAVLIGVLSKKPGVAGAGLLGMSGEAGFMKWKDIKKIKAYSGPGVLTLMNSWRVVTRVYCTPENFLQVLEISKKNSGLSPIRK